MSTHMFLSSSKCKEVPDLEVCWHFLGWWLSSGADSAPLPKKPHKIVSRLHTACGGLDAKPSGMSDHVSCSRNWVSIFLLTQQCSFKIPPCCILQCMYAIGQISTDVWFMTVKPRPVYHCPVKALQLTPSELQLTEPKAIVKKKNEYWFCFHLPKRWQEIYKSTTVIISVQISKVLVDEQEFTIHLFFFFSPQEKKRLPFTTFKQRKKLPLTF